VLPYVWLSLAIVSLWFPLRSAARRPLSRVVVSMAWLAVALAHASAAGIVAPVAILWSVALGVLAHRYWQGTEAPWSATRAATTFVVVVASLALMAHVVPGFSNVLVVRDAVLSPGAVPFTLFLNFDKAQIGLFLLAFGPPLLTSRAEWLTMLAGMLPRLMVVIAAAMAVALSMGQIGLDFKVPDIFPIWAWANLLFTCTAEEALFRGVVQRELQGPAFQSSTTTSRGLAGLAIASALFGVAHLAGGPSAVVLATIAGAGYGAIYWRTGRIEASILAHFLLNATHILAFTYPARA
jgi:uncharacterized protein